MSARAARTFISAVAVATYALAAPARGATEAGADLGLFARMAGRIEHVTEGLRAILAAIPQIPHDLSAALIAIAHAGDSRLHPLVPFAAAAAIALVVLAMPWLLHRLGRQWLRGWLERGTRFGAAVRLIVLDLGALAITVGMASVLVNLLFRREQPIGLLAVALVGAAVHWRMAMLVPELLLRPGDPAVRLVPVDDARARLGQCATGLMLALGYLLVTPIPVLVSGGLPQPTAQAIFFTIGTLIAAGGTYGVHRFFGGAGRPMAIAAIALILVVWIAWSAGVVTGDFDVYHGLVWSAGIVAAVLGLDRLLALALHEPAEGAAQPASHARMLVMTALRRIVLVVGGSVVAGLLARLWLVDISGVLDWESWVRVRESIVYALAALVAGYVAYELLRAWTDKQFGQPPSGLPAIGGDSGEAMPASRIVSLLPVLRGVMAGLIVATAGLVALSHLGVNVTPLVAGAGIFGLAISFGSQALVRDVVSGFFYMLDDAFRVGEYIAAGKYKGSVERIALRSVRLRHQNGQVHTIPYGQLGAVTNFSRDYLTIKFNLRLARNADIELLRKLVKGLGQEMLKDPELGKEFLQPLKMQGVADIEDNALVCRFKFTVRPTKPTAVQREAIKRIYKLCTENGLEFATHAVVVKSIPGAGPETSGAAARVATIAVAALPDSAVSRRQ